MTGVKFPVSPIEFGDFMQRSQTQDTAEPWSSSVLPTVNSVRQRVVRSRPQVAIIAAALIAIPSTELELIIRPVEIGLERISRSLCLPAASCQAYGGDYPQALSRSIGSFMSVSRDAGIADSDVNIEEVSFVMGKTAPTPTKPPVASTHQRRSSRPECQASLGPLKDPDFLSKVRPCGNLSSICTDIPLVEANRDYPGGGVGAVVPGQDYLVQFDIGLHPSVAKDILRMRMREIDSCINCPGLEAFGEQCLETVVTGGAMWGDLGLPNIGVSSGAYDCMGACGAGCSRVSATANAKDIGALDCLKHDVCSAWKSVHSGRPTQGFCHDPDCGDEAAMAIYNCWKGFRLFGSVGGSSSGPFSEPAVCDADDIEVKGCWSLSGWFTPGRCKVFEGWSQGQGIPDPHPLRSIVQRL